MYLNNFMVFNGCMVSSLRHGDEGLPETLAKISSHAMKNLTDVGDGSKPDFLPVQNRTDFSGRNMGALPPNPRSFTHWANGLRASQLRGNGRSGRPEAGRALKD
jgi:hypothetical protein